MASKNHLLIDGDILLYQTTQSCLNEADWGETYITCWLDMGELKYLLWTIIERWKEELKADDYTICLSDYDRNFRKELEPTYKEQRDGSKKPIGYAQAHNWIQGVHPCAKLPGLEADDVMGILATDGTVNNPIIVSDDKDMRQIPRRLYIPRKRETIAITHEDGYRYHMEQTLTGDRVDNYFGCPGVGPVRAAKALAGKEPSELWDAVVGCYVAAKQNAADALLQARLAKILQAEDYINDEVILWEPPVNTVVAEVRRASPSVSTQAAEQPSTTRSKTKSRKQPQPSSTQSTGSFDTTPMMAKTNLRRR